MLNCDQATTLCSDELERPLGLWQRVSLELHVMMCSGCAHYRRQTRAIRVAMLRYAEGRAPTTEPEEEGGVK